MYHLAAIFPWVRRISIPLSRDQVMLLMLAVNELLLGVETYLAHLVSGTIVPNEWIPILFGPISGVLLLLAGALSFRNRRLAVLSANLIFSASIVVGLLGSYFHFIRAILPNAPLGEQISVPLLIWAPPILAPLTFALIGWLGISTIWNEVPPDSGILEFFSGKKIQMPFSKTRAFFFMVSMGCLATVISSVLDHARTPFTNPWLWFPTAVGVFSTVVAAVLGFVKTPYRGDLLTYFGAMVLMVLTGLLGLYLHIQFDLASGGTIVAERFLRGAPFMAPMLFADMGAIGIIALLKPDP